MEKIEKKNNRLCDPVVLVAKHCVKYQPRVHGAPLGVIPINPFLRTPPNYVVMATGSVV